jgi:hypothetical protein
MKKFKDDVQPKDIQKIYDLLHSHPVNELWLKFVDLGKYGGTFKEREKAFNEYCYFRDLYLGYKPLVLQGISAEHRKRLQ